MGILSRYLPEYIPKKLNTFSAEKSNPKHTDKKIYGETGDSERVHLKETSECLTGRVTSLWRFLSATPKRHWIKIQMSQEANIEQHSENSIFNRVSLKSQHKNKHGTWGWGERETIWPWIAKALGRLAGLPPYCAARLDFPACGKGFPPITYFTYFEIYGKFNLSIRRGLK